jgi:hydrogenase/urease accessory protein HupE
MLHALEGALPSSRRTPAASVAGTALAVSLLLPAGAPAHGLGSAAGKSTLEFIPLGIEHMLLGWDHLLFILGAVLLAGTLGRAAKLITLFVAGHSLTLLVATLAGWQVSATAVDVVIALSVLFVGVLGVRGRPEHWGWVMAAIFGFGLVHGLGLSTRLQFLGLPQDGELARILAFNLGLEVGQLIAIGVIVGLGTLAARKLDDTARLRFAGFACIALAGFVAAAVLSLKGVAQPAPQQQQASSSRPADGEVAKRIGSCAVETGLQPPGGFGGGHPAKTFFEPDEDAPETDLDHVIGDGYVIVRYKADLPAAQVSELREWVLRAPNVIAAPAGGPVAGARATTAYRELTCGALDLAAVRQFSEQWLADVRNGTADR